MNRVSTTMRTASIGFAALLACVGLSTRGVITGAGAQTSTAPTFSMRRAVNVSPGTVYYDLSRGGSGANVYTPTDRQDLPQDYPLIRAMGFDTVRFAVEPTPFTTLQGARLDEAEAFIVGKLQSMLDAGLKVVLDLHTFEPENLGLNASGDINNARFNAYIGALRRLAAVANRYDPSLVALELMNEPKWTNCATDGSTAWNAYQPVMLNAARAAAPRTTLILTPGCLGGRVGLPKLDLATLNDPNTYFSVHLYEQVEITHEGYWRATDWLKHIEGFKYPADPNDLSSILAKTNARIDADTSLSSATKARWKSEVKARFTYLTGDGLLDRGRMGRYMDEIASWANANGIAANRIFIGEFGVIHRTSGDPQGTSYPDATSRTNWIRDARELIEAKGFAWAVFNYAGRFGILENLTMGANEPRVLLPEMRDALGLNDNGTSPPPTTTTTATTTTTTTTTTRPPEPTPLRKTVLIRSTCNKDLVLDVRKLSMEPGGVIQIYWPNRTTNQQFAMIPQGTDQGTNHYQLVAVHSGLAVGANNDQQGEPVVQRAVTGPDTDNWDIVAVDATTVEIRRADSGLNLDVQYASKSPGAPMQLWPANGSCAQRFRLEVVPA